MLVVHCSVRSVPGRHLQALSASPLLTARFASRYTSLRNVALNFAYKLVGFMVSFLFSMSGVLQIETLILIVIILIIFYSSFIVRHFD